LSYFLYGQSLPWQAILGLFLIVVGVILVNLFTYHES
jgi:multidrug transporter EmrE-like cation transporter